MASRSVYIIADLDRGGCDVLEDREEALRRWDLAVAGADNLNLSFIQVDLSLRPKVWTLGLRVDGNVVARSGRATRKAPGGACQLPPDRIAFK